MGQIFYATAYDIKNRKACVIDSDKFHANCYSFSGSVAAMHYLLREQEYRVMWGGNEVVINDNIQRFPREEDLFGLSTYKNLKIFEINNSNLSEKTYFERVKRLDAYSKEWTRLSVWDKAIEYFDLNNTKTIHYTGYLVNHTQKLSVCLATYYKNSTCYYTQSIGWGWAVDLIPALTETGDGLVMALLDGISVDTTEALAGTWCGDLMQIVNVVPAGYTELDCRFAPLWERATFYYEKFGVDEDGYILKDQENNRYEGCCWRFPGNRGGIRQVKAHRDGDNVKYVADLLDQEKEGLQA